MHDLNALRRRIASVRQEVRNLTVIGMRPDLQPAPRGTGPEPGAVGEGGGQGATGAPGSRSQDADQGQVVDPAQQKLPPPLIDKAGDVRLDKLNRTEDIDQVIRDSATRNDNYIRERRGVISEGAGTGPACLVAFTPFMWTGSGINIGKKPKKAEPKQRNSESVHQYAVGSGLPGMS